MKYIALFYISLKLTKRKKMHYKICSANWELSLYLIAFVYMTCVLSILSLYLSLSVATLQLQEFD